MSSSIVGELVPLFKKELEFCKVKQGETVALFTEPRFEHPSYWQAFMGAAEDLGADVFQVTIPAFRKPEIPQAITETLQKANLVIDMTQVPGGTSPWLYTDSHNKVLAAGVRTLMVNHPPQVLRRLLPDPAVAGRARRGAEFLEKAKIIRVKSDAGTDLTLSKQGRIAGLQQGYTDEPGRWDHWPSGGVAAAPLEDSADGTLVLDTGDWIVNFDRMVSEPIKISIKDGKISDIRGGADAAMLRDWFRLWNDEWAYVTSHIGWGCEHRAIWGASIMDVESYYASMLIAFGSNFFIGPARHCGLGGKNRSRAHMDIAARNCDFYVDDVLVTRKGQIVHDDLK